MNYFKGCRKMNLFVDSVTIFLLLFFNLHRIHHLLNERDPALLLETRASLPSAPPRDHSLVEAILAVLALISAQVSSRQTTWCMCSPICDELVVISRRLLRTPIAIITFIDR